jgi:hypothetical protein
MNNKVNEEEIVVTKPKTPKAGYESLIAPEGMANDAMSGWRTQLGSMNDQYGGDILGYATSEAFKGLDSKAQSQYYTDLRNYNSLYGTVSGYDADYMQQAKNAKKAEEYANTRRMLMERYLPETLAAMGYANTGLAGDAVLKLNNAYDNYAIKAQDTAAQNQADIMSKYRQSALDWNAARNEEAQEEAQAGDELYNAYLANIYTGKGLDTAAVEAAVQMGALTPAQRDELYAKAGGWSGDGVTKIDGIPLIQSSADKTVVAFYPSSSTATQIMNNMITKPSNAGGKRQEQFLNDVMNTSKNWGEEMSGTLVDFNYGWTANDNDSGTIYVFYWNPNTKKGEWRLTDLSRVQAAKNYSDRFYTGSLGDMENQAKWYSWTTDVRGKSFYDDLVRKKKRN